MKPQPKLRVTQPSEAVMIAPRLAGATSPQATNAAISSAEHQNT